MTTNLSLQRKTASRIAAVQCLYREAVNKEIRSAADQVAAIKVALAGNKAEQKLLVGDGVEPNYALLETILSGVREHGEAINERVTSVLSESWNRERTGALLIAILECAVFELFFGKDVKSGIIINEYAHITRSFFGEAEVDFVFGALSSLVQRYA